MLSLTHYMSKFGSLETPPHTFPIKTLATVPCLLNCIKLVDQYIYIFTILKVNIFPTLFNININSGFEHSTDC